MIQDVIFDMDGTLMDPGQFICEAAVFPPRPADIPHHDTHSAARGQEVKATSPDLPQLLQEIFMIVYVAQLRAAPIIGVLLQIPVRW